MNVGDIMTERVVSVLPTDRIADAIRLMLDNHISGLPVIDSSGTLVGILSEGDLMRRVETGTTKHRPRWLEFLLSSGRLASEYAHTHGRRVDEVMTRDVTSVSEKATLDDVVRLMQSRAIKRLPVLRDGKVVGIVTRANLLQALAALGGAVTPTHATDAAIRRRIMDAIQREPWGPVQSVNVVVRDGKVDLWGTVFDERERDALRVIVENEPGVTAFRDHVVSIEPMSGMVVFSPDETIV